MKTYNEFLDRKERDTKKHLDILFKVLQKEGLEASPFLKEEEPYVFLKSTKSNLSFDGVRIYKIGDKMAYRVQKEAETHPYGRAYLLDVEDMFNDLVSDNTKEEKAGKQVIKAIIEEFRSFFDKSDLAEREIRAVEFQKANDPGNFIYARNTGTDYANQIGSTKTYSPF